MRWKLWTPVAFGGGAALYFALPREPRAWVAWSLIAAAAGLLGAARRVGPFAARALMILAACGLAGFGLAKIRVERVRAPVAEPGAGPQTLQGWVLDVASPGQGGQRLLIAPYRVGALAPEATPIRVRLTLRDAAVIPASRRHQRTAWRG